MFFSWGGGTGGRRTWGKFGCGGAAESFKPWTCLRQNNPFFPRFRDPVFSIHQFSLSSRNDPPVLGEDINTIEARQALSVINVKFLVILLLYKTEWSWELRAWSHKMNAIDTSTNSPHYFYWKRIGITNDNLNCDVRVKALKSSLPNPLWDNKERECRWKLFRPLWIFV